MPFPRKPYEDQIMTYSDAMAFASLLRSKGFVIDDIKERDDANLMYRSILNDSDFAPDDLKHEYQFVMYGDMFNAALMRKFLDTGGLSGWTFFIQQFSSVFAQYRQDPNGRDLETLRWIMRIKLNDGRTIGDVVDAALKL